MSLQGSSNTVRCIRCRRLFVTLAGRRLCGDCFLVSVERSRSLHNERERRYRSMCKVEDRAKAFLSDFGLLSIAEGIEG